MVRIHPDPPMPGIRGQVSGIRRQDGAVAQLGEHLLCKQGVVGSIPISSTSLLRNGTRKQLAKLLAPGVSPDVLSVAL